MFNGGWTYRDRAEGGMRVADFYAARYGHSAREVWEARVARGEVSRNGAVACENPVLAEGDLLEWRRPPWNEGVFPDDIGIVYEDADVVALDKPSGLAVLPDGGWLENTLVGWLDRRFGQGRVVPAHRLNRGTSGIVLCGRTKRARAELARQFYEKTETVGEGDLEKIYLAKSVPREGAKAGDRVVVETPVGAVSHPVLGRVFAASADGLRARSECEIVEARPDSLLWRVRLVTGRAHQIRIHLASIGCPLLGDPAFLPGGRPNPFGLPGDAGYFLRAVKLTFRHPVSGRRITLEAPREPPC